MVLMGETFSIFEAKVELYFVFVLELCVGMVIKLNWSEFNPLRRDGYY